MTKHFENLDLSDTKKLPLWGGVRLFFFLLLIGVLIGELFGRTPIQNYLPPPSVGVDSFEFDLKIAYLERQIEERGELDCLIVGDSMANNGLNPTLIEDSYEAKTGSSLNCFNVGMPALTLDASGPVAEALVNRFEPHLLVFILSPRDFVPKYGKPFRHIATSEWARQNLGDFSLRGWAVNNSYSYRYLLSFQYWLNPSNRTRFIEASSTVSVTGYTPLSGFRTPHQVYSTQDEYTLDDADALEGLESLLQIQRDGGSVLVIDAPIQADYHTIYLENLENYEKMYVSPLKDVFAPLEIPFLLTDKFSLSVPDDAWYDPMHVNTKGVPIFSAWLGEELAKSYPPEFFR